MFDTSKKYGIVAAVDGSAESDAAVRFAARESAMRGVPVTLAHVVAPVVVGWPVQPPPSGITEWQQDNARHVLERAQDAFHAAADTPASDAHVEMPCSAVLPGLIELSEEATLMVVGSQGLGAVERVALGSVSSALVHHAKCPVAVIHGDGPTEADLDAPVLLGVDGSPASEAAIGVAFDEASRRHVELVALHAWSDVGVFPMLGMDWHEREAQGHQLLAERLAGWQERYPDVHIRRRIVCDRPARWLVDESASAQLVVVGSHGRGGFSGMLLGSVSSTVAQSSTAPVLVVHDGK